MSTVTGGSGNDTINGTRYSDSLSGAAGNDTVYGGSGTDTLNGDAGNDTLYGGNGTDYMYGGTGDDSLIGNDDASDWLNGGDGNDTISGGNSTGTDSIWGGEGADSVTAGAGNDIVFGGRGNDTVSGDDGNDTLVGEAGADQLSGGQGSDLIVAGSGNDTLDGGTENDTLSGGSGSDSIIGGSGDDSLRGDSFVYTTLSAYASTGSGSATTMQVQNTSAAAIDLYLIDGAGTPVYYATIPAGQTYSQPTFSNHNWLITEAGTMNAFDVIPAPPPATYAFNDTFDDTLDGGLGNDTILGELGNDIIYAGDGQDLVYGGTGNDQIYGGAGNDTLNGDEGDDTVYGGDGSDRANLGDGNDRFGDWSTEGGNDTVYGGAGNDTIIGGGDDDLLYGDAGNDSLSGGVGTDSIYGGAGNDVLVVTDDHQYDYFDGGTEWDQIQFANYLGTAGVTVTFSGSDAGSYVYGMGGATGNFINVEAIQGTVYGDTINAGADTNGTTLEGGGGNDIITGGSAADVVYGGEGADSLTGGAGNDYLIGGNGSDTFYGGDGDDVIDDEPGAASGNGPDTAYGGAGNDTIYLGDGNDLIYGGDGNEQIWGEAGNDRILGDAGNDLIYAGSGNDTLTGGTGDDTVYGEEGTDLIQFANGWGNDTAYGGESSGDLDHVDLYTVTTGLTVTFSGIEAGTITTSGNSLTFAEMERFSLGSGADVVYGGANTSGMMVEAYGGNDTVTGGSGNDTLYGNDGNDSIVGGAGNDLISGGAGNDIAAGGTGDDSIYGIDGDDTLTGGAGNDVLDGGAGTDRAVYSGPASNYTVTQSGANVVVTDTVATDGSDTISGIEQIEFGGVVYDLRAGTTGNDTFSDTGGNPDLIVTGDGDDSIGGTGGADIIYGGAGNDTLSGGAGADFVNGGTGLDIVDYSTSSAAVSVDLHNGTASGGDAAGDTFFGVDGIIGSAYADTLIGSDWESATPGDPFSTWIDGGAGSDYIDGRAGNDTLLGGTGADTIVGGAGADSLMGGDDSDVIYGGAGDTVIGGEGGTDSDTLILNYGEVESITYGGGTGEAGTVNFTSASGGGTLTFSEIENIQFTGAVDGTSGDDSISAGYVDAQGDVVDGVDGDADVIFVGAGNDAVNGMLGNDTIYGGTGDDTLEGGDGDDTLYGGADDDRLTGGDGADSLTGGTGDDTFVLTQTGSADTVTDFDMTLDAGRTADQLDVSDLRTPGGDPIAWRDVVVTDTVGDGSGDAVLTFPGGESVVLQGVAPDQVDTKQEMASIGLPCFVAGTRILTPTGWKMVETLRPGDIVVTSLGAKSVIWVGQRRLGMAALARHPAWRPVHFPSGAVGNTEPLRLSPQHGVLVIDASGAKVLVRAKHLAETGFGGARVANCVRSVTYHHIMLGKHAILCAAGAPTESFYPGPVAMAMLDWPARLDVIAAIAAASGQIAQGTPEVISKHYGARAYALVGKKAASGYLLPARFGSFEHAGAISSNPWGSIPKGRAGGGNTRIS